MEESLAHLTAEQGKESSTTGRPATNRLLPFLTIVVPCYNEEAVLPGTASQLLGIVEGLVKGDRVARDSSVYFVDDGSQDQTWAILERLAADNERFHGIKLSRNQGHQKALFAALMTAPGDVLISIDADLQDDASTIAQMIDAYSAGADIVYGVRKGRKADSFFKRATAELYYRLLQWMGVEIVFNHSDYRLLSRRAVEALREFKETNLFLRGLIPQLGFNTATVYYDRKPRNAGQSKYPLRKMIHFALEGITSFSTVPLKAITVIGLIVSFFSFGFGAWSLWAKVTGMGTVPGWASTVVPIYALGGIQLLCIGVIGQYMAKIYLETKARPRFIIEKKI